MLKTNKSSSSISARHATSMDEGSNSGLWGGKKSTFIGRDTNSGISAVQVQFSSHLIRAR